MTLEDRLALLAPGVVAWAPTCVSVREQNRDVDMTLLVDLDAVAVLEVRKQTAFRELLSAQNADGAFLVRDRDGRWWGEVVEPKRTLNPSKWDDVRQQVPASVVCLEFVARFLHLEPQGYRAWIGFQNDRLSMAHDTNPVLPRHPPKPIRASAARR